LFAEVIAGLRDHRDAFGTAPLNFGRLVSLGAESQESSLRRTAILPARYFNVFR
jgi:hypothetical protein